MNGIIRKYILTYYAVFLVLKSELYDLIVKNTEAIAWTPKSISRAEQVITKYVYEPLMA